MRERHTTIKFDVFSQYRVVIVVTRDFDNAIKNYGLEDTDKPSPSDCRALTYHLDAARESIVFLHHNCSIGDIAHECWHVIYHMFDYFGAELEDEVVAYHLDYLCQKTFDFAKGRK